MSCQYKTRARMARWQRLYYGRVARIFKRSLCWRRIAIVGEDWTNWCILRADRTRTSRAGSATWGRRKGCKNKKDRVQPDVEEVKQFPAVDRRRNLAVASGQREKGEVAVFQVLGKALTSSLQLDQVLRTIIETMDEFLPPDNWSLLLLDYSTHELNSSLA